MVKLNKPIRQARSPEDVMALVNERIPHLVERMFMDREWIWYCGPSLAGEDNKATREALKEFGFRYAMKPHLMPDGQTTGTWGNSCTRPTCNFRRGQHRPASPQPVEDQRRLARPARSQ